ncbi:MAG TPA: Gfo/Idh/MocA family oxidoreductase [Gaiellaceae bacterium]|nr:Gfo/Idh/MocA family oxidoreductase [Gaiellaceae bacterium]
MTPLRLGMLSTANINRAVVVAAEASDQVEVVAVASRDAGRAQAYAREHGLARAHGSYEALLDDSEVDAVYVSLPNSMHVDWSVRALEVGKHVLCEKPLARRPEDAERAFDAAERAGRILAEAFMYRHHPQAKRVVELVRGGAVGELRVLRAAFSFPLQGEENVRLRPELDGGALMDVGCYCVSGIRLLGGEPLHVAGEQVLGPTGVDLTFAGAMRLAGDVLSTFHASMALPSRQELEVLGSEGTLLVQAPWRVDLGGDVLLRRGDDVERIEIPAADAYRCELEDLAAAARGEREPLLGRADAVAQARTIDALYHAAEGSDR